MWLQTVTTTIVWEGEEPAPPDSCLVWLDKTWGGHIKAHDECITAPGDSERVAVALSGRVAFVGCENSGWLCDCAEFAVLAQHGMA